MIAVTIIADDMIISAMITDDEDEGDGDDDDDDV